MGDRYDFNGPLEEVVVNQRSFILPKELATRLGYCMRDYTIVSQDNAKTKVIYDCGASWGAFSLLMRCYYPNARIVAYEPDPCIFKGFRYVNDLYSLNLEMYEAALSDASGTGRLYFGKINSESNSLIESPLVYDAYYDVSINEVGELDHVEQIDILKIDTEGSEIPILLSALSRFTPWCIYLEYHSEKDRREIDNILCERDFLLYKSCGERPHLGIVHYVKRELVS